MYIWLPKATFYKQLGRGSPGDFSAQRQTPSWTPSAPEIIMMTLCHHNCIMKAVSTALSSTGLLGGPPLVAAQGCSLWAALRHCKGQSVPLLNNCLLLALPGKPAREPSSSACWLHATAREVSKGGTSCRMSASLTTTQIREAAERDAFSPHLATFHSQQWWWWGLWSVSSSPTPKASAQDICPVAPFKYATASWVYESVCHFGKR